MRFPQLAPKLNADEKRILFLSSIGGLLEFYDFVIFGIFVVYFANQFFPSANPLLSILASYTVFVTGYVTRPIGGIIFSHIGDKISRKTVLIITMVLMGAASFGMGVVPTYAQIGILAPILMLIFRIVQGLAIGGELPSIVVYVTESMPDKRPYALGTVFAVTVAGLIPGMLLNLIITHFLTVKQIELYGWRIPFLLGAILCLVAYKVRQKLHETKVFTALKHHSGLPIVELIRDHWGRVFIGIGLVSLMATPITLALIYMPTYLIKIVKLEPQIVSDAILLTTIVSVISIYVTGLFISNKIVDIIKLTRIAAYLIIIVAVICYFGIAHQYNLFIILPLFAVVQGGLVTLIEVLISYLFPIDIRLSGVALSYNVSFSIFAGLSPLIVTSMIEKTGFIYIVPVIMVIAVAVIALLALSRLSKQQML